MSKDVELNKTEVTNENTSTQTMTIYDTIIANMTPEVLADLGVRLVTINSTELCWVTSAGQLYPFDAKAQAVSAELTWLQSPTK